MNKAVSTINFGKSASVFLHFAQTPKRLMSSSSEQQRGANGSGLRRGNEAFLGNRFDTESAYRIDETANTDTPEHQAKHWASGAFIALLVGLMFTVLLATTMHSTMRGLFLDSGINEEALIIAQEHFANAVAKRTEHRLIDGSTMHLNAVSGLNITTTAKQQRVMMIQGEVYFRLPVDVRWPMAVEAGPLTVLVSGFDKGVNMPLIDRFAVNDDMSSMVSRNSDAVADEGENANTGVVSFAVERRAASSSVRVYEGRVQLKTSDGSIRAINAGQIAQWRRGELSIAAQQASFKQYTQQRSQLQTQTNSQQPDWISGQLHARAMPLAEVVYTLQRYALPAISYAPELRMLAITGSFDLDKPERSVAKLAEQYGLVIDKQSSRWILNVKS